MDEDEFWASLSARDLHPDRRTADIARFEVRREERGGSERLAALLAELVATLHEAGALPAEAVKGLATRWDAILKASEGAHPVPNSWLLTASDLEAELAWQLPGLVPPSDHRPPRVGRRRKPRRPPPA